MAIYLDSLIWDLDHWRARDGDTLLLDVRSLPECADPGTQLPLHTFVRSSGAPSGLLVGDDVQGFVTKRRRRAIGVALGLGSEELVSNRVDRLLVEIGHLGDATGQTRWQFWRGDSRAGFQVHLGPLHRRDPFDIAHRGWAGTLAVFQEDYRQLYGLCSQTQALLDLDGVTWDWVKRERAEIRAILLAGSTPVSSRVAAIAKYAGLVPPDHFRRVLSAAQERYRVHWQQLVEGMADEIRLVGPLPHRTAVADGFNRPNESLDAGNWFELVGNWSVVNSEVESSVGSARFETDLSTDDHSFQIIYTTYNFDNANVFGATARFSAVADTNYETVGRLRVAGFTQLRKTIAGVPTVLDTVVGAHALPGTLKVECSASTIKGFLDDVEKHSVIDLSITGNLRGGLRSLQNNPIGDDFAGSDLAAGGVIKSVSNNALGARIL